MRSAAVLLFLLAAGAAAQTGTPGFGALSRQATAARDAGNATAAIDLYRRALKLKPDWQEGWWQLGSIYYSQQKYPACIESVTRFTRLAPAAGAGFSILGLCEAENKDYAAARADLEQGQRLAGLSEDLDNLAKLRLAILRAADGASEQALGLYYTLAKRGNKLAPMAEAAGIAALRMPLRPDQLPADQRELVYLAGRAFLAVSAGRVAEATGDFEALVAKYPTAPNVHFFYGSFLLGNDPDQAIQELRKELELSPKHVNARITLAVEYLRRVDAEHALPLAKEAVALAPESFAAHTVLGKILLLGSDLGRGVQELELAEKLAPESPQPRIALASAYAKLGRTEDAARERQEFLRLNKNGRE